MSEAERTMIIQEVVEEVLEVLVNIACKIVSCQSPDCRPDPPGACRVAA